MITHPMTMRAGRGTQAEKGCRMTDYQMWATVFVFGGFILFIAVAVAIANDKLNEIIKRLKP